MFKERERQSSASVLALDRHCVWNVGFKAHRLLYHSTLGVRVIKKKRRGFGVEGLGGTGLNNLTLLLLLGGTFSTT